MREYLGKNVLFPEFFKDFFDQNFSLDLRFDVNKFFVLFCDCLAKCWNCFLPNLSFDHLTNARAIQLEWKMFRNPHTHTIFACSTRIVLHDGITVWTQAMSTWLIEGIEMENGFKFTHPNSRKTMYSIAIHPNWTQRQQGKGEKACNWNMQILFCSFGTKQKWSKLEHFCSLKPCSICNFIVFFSPGSNGKREQSESNKFVLRFCFGSENSFAHSPGFRACRFCKSKQKRFFLWIPPCNLDFLERLKVLSTTSFFFGRIAAISFFQSKFPFLSLPFPHLLWLIVIIISHEHEAMNDCTVSLWKQWCSRPKVNYNYGPIGPSELGELGNDWSLLPASWCWLEMAIEKKLLIP